MGDHDERDAAEEDMAVGVAPSAHATDAPVPPVTHDATVTEPTCDDPDAGVPAPVVAPVPQQRPETSGKSDGAVTVGARIRSWFLRRDVIITAVVLIIGTGVVIWWERQLAEGQIQLSHELADSSEVQENTRFVRQVVIDGADAKPFRGLNLHKAALSGLVLGCDGTDPKACADLFGANLSGADLALTDLSNADLNTANLSGADLFRAILPGALLRGTDLTGTFLRRANLTGADLTCTDPPEAQICTRLTDADLRGAILTDAKLTEADLTDSCHDDSTTWPDGFMPPDPVCP